MFKYELHMHSSGCSACGASTIESLVEKACELGYLGVVITNHFYRGNTSVDRSLPWEEFVAAYEDDWLRGKALGEKLGIDVIFGIEEGYMPGSGKEVLIYGITPDELKAESDFKNYTLKEICDFVHRHRGFICLAHPFRADSYIPDPDWLPDLEGLDGAESFNGSGESEKRQNRNAMAAEFAASNSLKPLSGGDIHSEKAWTVAKSGVAVEQRVFDTKHLAKILHSGDYKLIVNGEIL